MKRCCRGSTGTMLQTIASLSGSLSTHVPVSRTTCGFKDLASRHHSSIRSRRKPYNDRAPRGPRCSLKPTLLPLAFGPWGDSQTHRRALEINPSPGSPAFRSTANVLNSKKPGRSVEPPNQAKCLRAHMIALFGLQRNVLRVFLHACPPPFRWSPSAQACAFSPASTHHRSTPLAFAPSDRRRSR